MAREERHIDDRVLADVARLADGTLPPRRRAAVEARVAESPQLRALLDEQRRALARRTDRISGRPVTTVYYGRGRLRIAYAIVAGAQVPPPVATGKIIRSHTLLRHFRAGGRTVVTWIRHGHTCVLSARDVPLQAMVGLAAWKDGAGLTF